MTVQKEAHKKKDKKIGTTQSILHYHNVTSALQALQFLSSRSINLLHLPLSSIQERNLAPNGLEPPRDRVRLADAQRPEALQIPLRLRNCFRGLRDLLRKQFGPGLVPAEDEREFFLELVALDGVFREFVLDELRVAKF